jgi:hypothetical protein
MAIPKKRLIVGCADHAQASGGSIAPTLSGLDSGPNSLSFAAAARVA